MTEKYQPYNDYLAERRAEAEVVSDLVGMVHKVILEIWTSPPLDMDQKTAMDQLDQIPVRAMLEQTGIPALDKERREALVEKLGRELAAKYL